MVFKATLKLHDIKYMPIKWYKQYFRDNIKRNEVPEYPKAGLINRITLFIQMCIPFFVSMEV